MTLATNDERFRQPMIKRLGFDDGWWFFCPHFLNLGLPLVLVDASLLPGADLLNLEPFGTREPGAPLPSVDLHIVVQGDGVSLHSASPARGLVAGHWFRTLTLPRVTGATRVGIFVGDSYSVNLGWSALWRCRIGTVAVVEPPTR